RAPPTGGLGDGLDADTDDGEVTLDPAPLLRDHRLEPPVALEPLGSVAEDHLDAVVPVQGLDPAAERRPEPPPPGAGPAPRPGGVTKNSATVTPRPSCRSEAATSAPMKPIPTMTAFEPSF